MLARTDKSVTVLTGMIIAALYLILLVGFSQESYMRRDAAAARFELASAASATGQVLTGDASKRVCRAEHPICATLFTGASEQEHCANSVEIMRRLLGEPGAPLTLERLRSVLHAESDEFPPARF
jgi:hypothetical protein